MEDFPAPVLPIIPIFSFGYIVNEILLRAKTFGKSSF
jgi:hypothetical protein